MDREDYPYRIAGPSRRLSHIALPLAVLLVVVAIVSALVFADVLQGSAERYGPGGPSTTRPTVLIQP